MRALKGIEDNFKVFSLDKNNKTAMEEINKMTDGPSLGVGKGEIKNLGIFLLTLSNTSF